MMILLSCSDNLGTSLSSYWGAWLLDVMGVSQVQFGGMVGAQTVLVFTRMCIPFLVLVSTQALSTRHNLTVVS